MRNTGRLIATTASINRVPSSTVLMRHYRYCCTVQAPAQTQFRLFSPIESSPKAMDCLVLMRNTGRLIATTASINRPILNRAHETLSVLLHSAGTRSNSISSLLTDRVFTDRVFTPKAMDCLVLMRNTGRPHQPQPQIQPQHQRHFRYCCTVQAPLTNSFNMILHPKTAIPGTPFARLVLRNRIRSDRFSNSFFSRYRCGVQIIT